ncbi:MAG: riboflavin biosynthesis protein RibF [Oscillospiraceae bacterium]|nr:riboflavin biosynthesis protein RibF [Oscillospiraceae bacterium]
MHLTEQQLQAETAVALGNFDGVHLGHRAVLEAAAANSAAGLLPVALTFSPHPQAVLHKKAPPALCEGRIRDELFRACGVSLRELDFYELKDMQAEAFFYEILLGRFRAKFISCGYNYSFGKRGEGDIALLSRLCEEKGVVLRVIPEVRVDGLPISSSNIRKELAEGDVRLANLMLGRAFSYDFLVVSGDRRGRLLGFPTINQFFPEGFAVPRYGVYAARAFAEGKWYDAMTNIGLRPTVGTDKPRSETCLLGYSGDLYGQNVEVRLYQFLRPEIKFDSFEALSAQIAQDAETVRRTLQTVTGDAGVHCK